MSKRPKPTSTYEEEKAIWYKKLEESGFEDIESDEHHLKFYSLNFARHHATHLSQTGPLAIASKIEYYSMANKLLNSYRFKSRVDKIIWEYHANAISIRDIVILLDKVGVKTSRTAVWAIVKRLETLMKKKYLYA